MMPSMSDKKQVMVRLDPEDYEILRRHAYEARAPVAVLARVLIIQRLEQLELEPKLQDDGQDEPTVEASPAPRPRRRSPNAKRSKKKKARR